MSNLLALLFAFCILFVVFVISFLYASSAFKLIIGSIKPLKKPSEVREGRYYRFSGNINVGDRNLSPLSGKQSAVYYYTGRIIPNKSNEEIRNPVKLVVDGTYGSKFKIDGRKFDFSGIHSPVDSYWFQLVFVNASPLLLNSSNEEYFYSESSEEIPQSVMKRIGRNPEDNNTSRDTQELIESLNSNSVKFSENVIEDEDEVNIVGRFKEEGGYMMPVEGISTCIITKDGWMKLRLRLLTRFILFSTLSLFSAVSISLVINVLF